MCKKKQAEWHERDARRQTGGRKSDGQIRFKVRRHRAGEGREHSCTAFVGAQSGETETCGSVRGSAVGWPVD